MLRFRTCAQELEAHLNLLLKAGQVGLMLLLRRLQHACRRQHLCAPLQQVSKETQKWSKETQAGLLLQGDKCKQAPALEWGQSRL
jgi:hypothetical protein